MTSHEWLSGKSLAQQHKNYFCNAGLSAGLRAGTMSNKFILSIGKGLCCTTFWHQGDNTPPSQLEGQRKNHLLLCSVIVNFKLHISPPKTCWYYIKNGVLTAFLSQVDFNWEHFEEIRSSFNSWESQTSVWCYENYQGNEIKKSNFIWKLNVLRNIIKGFFLCSPNHPLNVLVQVLFHASK